MSPSSEAPTDYSSRSRFVGNGRAEGGRVDAAPQSRSEILVSSGSEDHFSSLAGGGSLDSPLSPGGKISTFASKNSCRLVSSRENKTSREAPCLQGSFSSSGCDSYRGDFNLVGLWGDLQDVVELEQPQLSYSSARSTLLEEQRLTSREGLGYKSSSLGGGRGRDENLFERRRSPPLLPVLVRPRSLLLVSSSSGTSVASSEVLEQLQHQGRSLQRLSLAGYLHESPWGPGYLHESTLGAPPSEDPERRGEKKESPGSARGTFEFVSEEGSGTSSDDEGYDDDEGNEFYDTSLHVHREASLRPTRAAERVIEFERRLEQRMLQTSANVAGRNVTAHQRQQHLRLIGAANAEQEQDHLHGEETKDGAGDASRDICDASEPDSSGSGRSSFLYGEQSPDKDNDEEGDGQGEGDEET